MAAAALVFALPSMADDTDCTARNATRATVGEIAGDQEAFNGRCVRVDAVMYRYYLVDDVDGVYLQSSDAWDPSSTGRRIGLDNPGGHFSEAFRPVSIVGRVQDCKEMRAAAHASRGPDEIGWISGYCHQHDGGYLWVKSLRRRHGPSFVRQLDARGRENYGDLLPAPTNWPHSQLVEIQASQFLAALRARDRDRLLALHFPESERDSPEDAKALLHFLVEDRGSPFAALRTTAIDPQRVILVERNRLHTFHDARHFDADDYASVVCFCREPDCTGRWPIATFDADNLRSRPYACTFVEGYVLPGEQMVPHFMTPIGKHGLREP